MRPRYNAGIDGESLQADVMRFMAIIAFCLLAILALVRDVEAPAAARKEPAAARKEPAAASKAPAAAEEESAAAEEEPAAADEEPAVASKEPAAVQQIAVLKPPVASPLPTHP